MSNADRQKWDAKYAGRNTECMPADDWLIGQAEKLPPGRALDIACGLGHNSIWLAQQGWNVDAVDISPAGLRIARKTAADAGMRSINWIAADLDEFVPAESAYDLVIVFRFLDRNRLPEVIVPALKPGGRLLYETFLAAECERSGTHIRNPAFTLSAGELPRLYSALEVVEYREETLADRTIARFSANRRSASND